MEVVEFPRFGVGPRERHALRLGVAAAGTPRHTLRLVEGRPPSAPFCASCASPIEFGPVTRGGQAYCSIECSLGGGTPA